VHISSPVKGYLKESAYSIEVPAVFIGLKNINLLLLDIIIKI